MNRLVPLAWVSLLPLLFSRGGNLLSDVMFSAADLVLLAFLPVCTATWLRKRRFPLTSFDGSLLLLLSSFTLGLLVRWFHVGDFSFYAWGTKYFGLLFLVSGIYFLLSFVRDQGELKRVVHAWVLSALIVAALGMVGLALLKGGVPTFLMRGERVDSVMGSPNRLGLYMAVSALMATSLASAGYYRFLTVATAFVGGITVVMTLSRGTWMAYSAGLVVLLVLWWQQLKKSTKYWLLIRFILLVGIALVALPYLFPSFWVVATNFRTIMARMDSNVATLELIAESPLLGLGLGVTLERLVWFDWALETSYLMLPHNTALWLWSDLGLPGLLSFFLLSVSFLRIAVRLSRSADPFHAALGRGLAAGYVAFLAFSIGHEALYQRVVWLLFGLGAVAQRLDSSSKIKNNGVAH